MKTFLSSLITGSLSLFFLLAFVILKASKIESYWTSLTLGLFLTFLLVALFLFVLTLLRRQKPIPLEDGIRCPHCGKTYSKEEESCPHCGEKNPGKNKRRKEEWKMKTVQIVIPCYNEEPVLHLYFEAVDPVLKDIADFEVGFVLVNDGSKDKTWEVMKELHQKRKDVTIVNLSRNYGQNPALTAGLSTATADYVIMMDADLQDPVTLIKDICEKFKEGYDVVSPHRSSRETDTKFKRDTAALFYNFTNRLEGKQVLPPNVTCFRGLSRRAVDAILALPEKDRLLVNEIPLVGFKTCQIDFKREERAAGKSKYNVNKMVNYTFDIISSGTAKPLYLPVKIGALSSAFFAFSTLVLLVFYFLGIYEVLYFFVEPLRLFLILSAIFFGFSLLIFFIGILALYLHNVLVNTRGRPTFVIDEVLAPEKEEKEEEKDHK